jgi:tetratricopeptide (TPR) repeat protein
MEKKKAVKPGAKKAAAEMAASAAEKRSREFFSPARIIVLFALIEIALILLMYPDYRATALRRNGDNAFLEKNYQNALRYYQKLLRIAPDSSTVNRLVANTYYSLGDLDNAISYYERVLEIDSTVATIHATLGSLYYKKGDIGKATENLLAELKRNPDDAEANFYYGKYLFDQAKYAEAAKYFQRIATNPGYREQLKHYWKTIEAKVLRAQSS